MNFRLKAQAMLFQQRTTTKLLRGLLLIALSTMITAAQTTKPAPQVVYLSLRPHGFEPAKVTLKAGRMFLSIANHTGKPNLTYHVVSTSGQAFSAQGSAQMDMVSSGTKPQQTVFLTLAAGKYTVTEASQPQWTCTLTVQ
jgi:hypothetical protein